MYVISTAVICQLMKLSQEGSPWRSLNQPIDDENGKMFDVCADFLRTFLSHEINIRWCVDIARNSPLTEMCHVPCITYQNFKSSWYEIEASVNDANMVISTTK